MMTVINSNYRTPEENVPDTLISNLDCNILKTITSVILNSATLIHGNNLNDSL